MMRKAISVVSTLGLAVGLMFGVAGGASAYPPGTALTVTASPNPVAVNAQVTITARHVGPGCLVTFVLDGRSVTVASSAGTAFVKIKAPSTPGPRTVSATTSRCSTIERAYTRIVVTGPVVNCPKTAARNRVFACTAANFPRNTRLTMLFITGWTVVYQPTRTSSTGAVTVLFKLARRGTYLVTAVAGSMYATTTIRIT